MNDEIHLWTVRLDPPLGEVERALASLSAAEQARAARFRDPRHGHRYAVCRAALRRRLGMLLDRDPAELIFTLTAYGKPEMIDLARHQLHFNVTHSSNLAIIGVRRGGPLGVDIERIRPDFATDDIAARFFSLSERDALRAIPAHQRAEEFFRIWTRKEAFIKAVGEGLSYPLDEFDVNLSRDAPAVLQVKGDVLAGRAWTLREIDVPTGFVAALAVEGPLRRVALDGVFE